MLTNLWLLCTLWRRRTFAADFLGFMTGRKKVQPYAKVCRVLYRPRRHWFMYDADYERKGNMLDGDDDDDDGT
jgi:hypothetical protein